MTVSPKKNKIDAVETGNESGLPEGWALTRLGDLSTYVTSGSRDWSKYYADHGALFIRTQDINENVLGSIDGIARVALPQKVEGKRTLVRRGDLLVTITGANVGKCALVDSSLPEAYVSQSVALVRLSGGCNGRFVQRQLISPDAGEGRTLLQDSAYGVGRPVLNLDNLKDLPVALAPDAEQIRIVEQIEGLLPKIENSKHCLAACAKTVKKFRQAVLLAACSGKLTEDWRTEHPHVENAEQLFQKISAHHNARQSIIPRDLEAVPESWKWVAFGDLIEELRNGISTKREIEPPGKPILRISAVRAGKVILNDYRYLRTKDSFAKYRLKNGDLLFTRYNGSLELLGVCGMVRGLDNDLLYPDKLMRARFDHPWVLPSYAEIFFCSPIARDRMTEKSKSSAGQQGVSGANVKAQPFALPPLEEQGEIVRRVEALLKLADAIEKRVAAASLRAERMAQAILAKAFRGELVPTEAELARREGRNFEPASVLLEQIKATRGQASALAGSVNGNKRRRSART